MSTPAGWYPDPSAPPARDSSTPRPLRWWDGQAWTENVHVPETPVGGLSFEKPDERWGGPGSAHPQARPVPWSRGTAVDPAARQTHTPDGQPLGNLGLRLLARVIDYVLTSAITALAAWGPLQTVVTAFETTFRDSLAAARAGSPPPSALSLMDQPGLQSAMTQILWITVVISAVYVIAFTRFFGGTPGKLLCRLRVRGWDRSGLPTWGQAILRWLTREAPANLLSVVGGVYLLLDSLWPLWDKRRQGLHDKLGKTVVVRR
ncbi:RDD family protein [Kineococcus gynurae]|uniref:RDD family protein n=1 Tax=Kineococcus gynurae TaxID=452979 RepID=A0ABV5LX97_9ACTN